MTVGGATDGLEERARAILPEAVFRYIAQGAGHGTSTGEAVAAWDGLRFLPRALREVGTVSCAITLLGTPLTAPVAVAPTTLQRATHPEGEVAMARGAHEAGSLLVLSSNAGTAFSDIAATRVPWWLQLYLTADRSVSLPTLRAAVEAGARAVVLTADTPIVGTKFDEGASVWELLEPGMLRVNLPGDADGPGAEKATDLGPHDIEWLMREARVPVVVKGVLRPDDARRCVDAGAAAVWVSNHGGRQLDRAATTASALPAVVSAVATDAEVYVDGGIRSGAHVLAALALGARAAFVGRPSMFALAEGGATGVANLLDGLRDELVEAMTLAGCVSPDAVAADLLQNAP